LKASLSDVEARLKHQGVKLEEFGPQTEASKQKLEFLTKDYKGRLGDYLNDPENAKRLFGYASATDGDTSIRGKLLAELLERLERQEIIYHLMASYEIRPISAEYSPPVHLQQLRKALVSKEEMKRVEGVLKQVPARQLSLKPIEELSKKIRRISREEKMSFVVRFAEDFLRLRRDVRNAEHLTTCMERINLVSTEQARELSRLNNQLYECVLQEEAKPQQDHVVSHVIIKADVRGSAKMTQDLLSRGLNPASHFSLNLHEPVKKLLDRYAAKKVFIEGDAIILAIFETESTRAYARAVAKACILSRQILAVCNSYNDRAVTSDLPALELGIGVAFQGSAPTYWTDGDSRIMISKALNLSDRLSGCAKIAKRLMTGQKTHFSVFQFLTAMEGASAEELDEFLVRFNRNGIELNEEGFEKLSEEISLDSIETKQDMPWGKENVTLHYGEVPMGDSVELLVLRKGLARELLPDGAIGVASSHPYYEVCTSGALYDLVAALIRSQTAAVESTRA
jgi:2'-5' RNA ligase